MNIGNMDADLLKYLIYSIASLIVGFTIIFFILKRIGKNPRNILPVNFAHRIKIPLILFIVSLAVRIGVASKVFDSSYAGIVGHIGLLLLILSLTWFIVILIRVAKKGLIRKYDITAADNLNARRVYTQFNILERVAVFVIIVLATGAALMTFDSIQSIGASVLASAGIAGIILGFSAQKALGTLLAGIQIAITQPIRLDDVVIVEGEWGRIEEITLTYVVISIWDKRRLSSTYYLLY